MPAGAESGVVGIGIDLVDARRFGRLLAAWPRMESRLFTEGERVYAHRRVDPVPHLAARFAAKEAAFKALGEGWPAVGWHDVEVVATTGAPRLVLTGRAAALAQGARGLLTMSHDGGFAIAQVVLLTGRSP